jgi:hypothetical protein
MLGSCAFAGGGGGRGGGEQCKGKPCNTPIYWLQSPISAVALILMYFLAIWRSEALHYYKQGGEQRGE